MACEVQRIRTVTFWTQQALGATAVDAFEAARGRLRNQAKRWADSRRQRLTCPEGCTNPHGFSYSFEELAVEGHYNWKREIYVFRIQARLHAQWVCDPIEVEEPTPPPEDELPGETGTDGGGTPTGEEEGEGPELPCVVSIDMNDQSQRIGQGVFDWDIDASFEATPSNPNHDWKPGSVVLDEVHLVTSGSIGVDWIDDILGSAGSAFGRTDLSSKLTLSSGPGWASISGHLSRDGDRLPLDASSGPRIRVKVTATDDNGDTRTRVFFVDPD